MKLNKCLNCGASLRSNKRLGIKFCAYCGEEYPINVESGDESKKEWKKKYTYLINKRRDELEKIEQREREIEEERIREEKERIREEEERIREEEKRIREQNIINQIGRASCRERV